MAVVEYEIFLQKTNEEPKRGTANAGSLDGVVKAVVGAMEKDPSVRAAVISPTDWRLVGNPDHKAILYRDGKKKTAKILRVKPEVLDETK